MRSFQRSALDLRPVTLTPGVSRHAEGSVQVEFGHTRVLVTCSVEERVPPHLMGKGTGWVTAEYGMLPRSTHSRNQREAAKGKQTGRTQEIQRLIGRSMRAAVDLAQLGPRTLTLDCDVLQADGGTRTASITGAYVALALALRTLKAKGAAHQAGEAHPARGRVRGRGERRGAGGPGLRGGLHRRGGPEPRGHRRTGAWWRCRARRSTSSFDRKALDAMLDGGLAGIAQLCAAQAKVLGEGG